MAVTLTATARNAACNAVVDLLDGGDVQLQTAGSVVIATLELATPAFGAAAAGVAAANAIASAVTVAAGTVTTAVWRNSGGTEVFRCSVTATGGGGDIEMTSVAFAIGETAEITAYSHTQPATGA